MGLFWKSRREVEMSRKTNSEIMEEMDEFRDKRERINVPGGLIDPFGFDEAIDTRRAEAKKRRLI